MKTIYTFLLLLAITINSFAQQPTALNSQFTNELPRIYVNENVSTHMICSENIQFVDISTGYVLGDMPLTNILRIKPRSDSARMFQGLAVGVVTLVAEKYMVQYQMIYVSEDQATNKIMIDQGTATNIINTSISLSTNEMKTQCKRILEIKKSYFSVKAQASKAEIILNNLFVVGDYYFVDISLNNKTNIKYDIDQFRFKIEDKKQTKATNFQAIEIPFEFRLYDNTSFKKRHRNIFVFKKFTFPNEKVFTIEVAEEQISGRQIKLYIDYSDVLNADTI